MLATDLADYLVGKGVPFREAHGTVRDLCTYCQDQGKDLQGLTLEEYQRFSPHFDGEVYNITPGSSAAARDNPGGTAPSRVAEGLRWAKETLEAESDGL